MQAHTFTENSCACNWCLSLFLHRSHYRETWRDLQG